MFLNFKDYLAHNHMLLFALFCIFLITNSIISNDFSEKLNWTFNICNEMYIYNNTQDGDVSLQHKSLISLENK